MMIEVSDTGSGIPTQDLDRIFNAFYQVNHQYKKEGLGLGLSIAKNIVEKLNGEIHVKSVARRRHNIYIYNATCSARTSDQ
jgi:signal transduction histidine kinase